MQCRTRDFGELEIGAEQIIKFVQPLFGFEKRRSYALIFDELLGAKAAWLQSVEEPGLCFTLLNSRSLAADCRPKIPEELFVQLGGQSVECWVVCVLHSQEATVNLKSPIFINREARLGAQLLLGQDVPVRYPLQGGALLC